MGLLIALVFGLMGAVAIFLFVGGADSRAPKSDQQEKQLPGGLGKFGVPSKPGEAGIRDVLNNLFQPLADRSSQRAAKKGKPNLSRQLMRADITMRPSEFVGIQFGVAILIALIGLLRFGLGPQFVLLGLGGWFIPGFYLNWRINKRLKSFNNQLGDNLLVLSNSLKAGHSFAQAIDGVAKNGIPPIADEFRRVIREVNLGSSLEDALAKMVDRVNSQDLDLVVTAIGIHRQVGGNLAEVLENISHTIRERVRIKGEVSTLTAQARGSGQMITGLPIFLGIFLYFVAPTYFRPMTTTPIGWIMFGIAGFLIFVGNAIIRKVVAIEI